VTGDEYESPTDPAEVARRVCEAVDAFVARFPRRYRWDEKGWQDLKSDLARWLRGLEPALAFNGILCVAERSTNLYHQDLAGELLHRMGRRCPLPQREVVRRLSSNFNPSANRIPFYLAEAFGRDPVLADLHELRTATADPLVALYIDTFRFWLGADSRDELNGFQ
jgi:hypothetical protein